MFDPIEQIQFAFDPDFDTFYNLTDVKILSKPFNQYSNVQFPRFQMFKIFYQCEMFAESRTPTFDSLMPKLYCVFSKIIHLKNLQLSATEFLSILSPKTQELICESVTTTSEVKFSEILFITKNIQKLEFTEANVIVENSWLKELVKNVRLKKFASLRLTI
uniref:Uncharacterized protein n=1 Tax=Panagrolaimus sp. PS1159 TaxID=55785 RepID=A0AC35EYG2_9BILA